MVVIIISRDGGGGGSNSSSNNKNGNTRRSRRSSSSSSVIRAFDMFIHCIIIAMFIAFATVIIFYHYHFHWYHQIIIVTLYIQCFFRMCLIIYYIYMWLHYFDTTYIYMNITHVCMKICVPSELFAAITRFNSNLFQKCLLPRWARSKQDMLQKRSWRNSYIQMCLSFPRSILWRRFILCLNIRFILFILMFLRVFLSHFGGSTSSWAKRSEPCAKRRSLASQIATKSLAKAHSRLRADSQLWPCKFTRTDFDFRWL